MGAIFAPTRFSLVRISIRDLVADGKSLVRNSGVGGGGDNRVLRFLLALESRKLRSLRKILAPIKIKSALPPPPKPPPLRRGILCAWGFPAESTHFSRRP